MYLILHALIAASYLVIASAAALVMPLYLPALSPAMSPVMGAIIFVSGGLLHFIYVQSERQRHVEAELLTIRRAYDHLAKSVDNAHGEADRLREAIAAGPGNERISEVVAEVKVLQGLVERFQGPKSRPPPNSKTAAKTGRPTRPVAAEPPPEPRPAYTPSETEILDIVREGIRADRVEVFVQPITSLPQRKVRFLECYTRIRNAAGDIIVPEQYIDLARREGLVPAIDNLLLFRTVQLIRRDQRQRYHTLFFCNVASDSVSDKEFFSDFVDFVAENDKLASQLIFEFRQRDLEQADESLLEKLRRLSALGFRFSVDGVRHINFDLAALARDHVKFIKIDAHRVLEHVEIDGGVADIHNLQRARDRAGIDLIVEKIETEKQLVELLDFNIDYGEGCLFGEPRLSKDA